MLEKLRELLKWKKSNAFYAEKLGITEQEVKELLKELRQPLEGLDVPPGTFTNNNDGTWEWTINNDKGTLTSTIETNFEPKDDLELAQLHKVNLDKYKISNYYSKLKPNGKFTSTVFCALKKPQDYTPEDFAKFLDKYAESTKHYEWTAIPNSNTEEIDVEISIADFHLAKKTLENETIEDKVNQYIQIIEELLFKVRKVYKINKLVFPISNDFFHTDNYQNQTTNGTPQDVLTGFDHEYEVGFDLLVRAINRLQSTASEVLVLLVQGNHDRTKGFYVAHALDVYFKNNERVTFDRTHGVTKSVVLGNTFIGYHHGNCKIDDLPLLFATGKDSSAFGNAVYREVHTADKHHYMAKEVKGVRIQQVPSLSGTDRWHLDNNFVHSVRAGLALCYDKVKGKTAEFESRI